VGAAHHFPFLPFPSSGSGTPFVLPSSCPAWTAPVGQASVSAASMVGSAYPTFLLPAQASGASWALLFTGFRQLAQGNTRHLFLFFSHQHRVIIRNLRKEALSG